MMNHLQYEAISIPEFDPHDYSSLQFDVFQSNECFNEETNYNFFHQLTLFFS